MMFLSPDSPVSDAHTLVIGYFCRNIPSCISFRKLFFRCFYSALVNRLFYINLRNHYKTGRDCGSSPWSLPVFYCSRKSLTLMILGSSLCAILSSGLHDPLCDIILRHETSLFRLSLHLLLKTLQRIHSRVHHPGIMSLRHPLRIIHKISLHSYS